MESSKSNKLRTLTEPEIRRLKNLAQHTRLEEMVSFFETLPRRFTIPNPLLLGSNGDWEVLAEGLTSRHAIISEICHLDEPLNLNLFWQRTISSQWRENPIGTMHPIYKELRKGFEKLCLAEALGGCNGEIVRSHSIQKASFRKHAPSGHVYEFDPFSARKDGIDATPIGIHEATTFTGFCACHDQHLFKRIETMPFTAAPEQFFLHHYRAVCHAFYNRAFKFKIIKQAHSENSEKPNIGSLSSIEKQIKNNELDELEIRRHKSELEANLQVANWGHIEGYAWIGTRIPTIFVSEYVAPRKDFQGKIIQETKGPQALDWVSLTVTSANDNALVMLCGRRGSSVLQALVSSLRRLPRNRRTMAIANYIFCQLENFVMLPSWWDALEEPTRQKIKQVYESRFFPRVLPAVCQWNLSEFR